MAIRELRDDGTRDAVEVFLRYRYDRLVRLGTELVPRMAQALWRERTVAIAAQRPFLHGLADAITASLALSGSGIGLDLLQDLPNFDPSCQPVVARAWCDLLVRRSQPGTALKDLIEETGTRLYWLRVALGVEHAFLEYQGALTNLPSDRAALDRLAASFYGDAEALRADVLRDCHVAVELAVLPETWALLIRPSFLRGTFAWLAHKAVGDKERLVRLETAAAAFASAEAARVFP